MVRSKTTKAKGGSRKASGSARGGSARQASRSPARSPARSSARSKMSASASRGGRAAPGISRIDQEATRTHGYFVRLGYERTSAGTWRPRHRAFFGDVSYGGKTKALRAAKDWLAEVTGDD